MQSAQHKASGNDKNKAAGVRDNFDDNAKSSPCSFLAARLVSRIAVAICRGNGSFRPSWCSVASAQRHRARKHNASTSTQQPTNQPLRHTHTCNKFVSCLPRPRITVHGAGHASPRLAACAMVGQTKHSPAWMRRYPKATFGELTALVSAMQVLQGMIAASGSTCGKRSPSDFPGR